MRGAVVRCADVHLPGALDALERQQQLGFAGRPCQFLHRVPVAVAAAEVHLAVDAGGIALQHLLHETDALEELAPVERPDEAKTGDQVGHARLLGGLVLPVVPDRVLHRLATARQRLVQLAVEAGGARPECARAPQEVRDERGVHLLGPLAIARSFGFDRRRQAVRRQAMRAHLAQDVAPLAEVVDQRELQHAGPRPQLADRQRRDALEGGDETLQALCVDPAGTGPHQLDGQRVDARQAGELIRSDSRQSLEVRRRQVVLDVAGRGRDDVEIVEQPFGRRRHGLALGITGKLGIDLPQRPHVRLQLLEVGAPVAGTVRSGRDQGGEPPRVLFKQLDAEQLDCTARDARNCQASAASTNGNPVEVSARLQSYLPDVQEPSLWIQAYGCAGIGVRCVRRSPTSAFRFAPDWIRASRSQEQTAAEAGQSLALSVAQDVLLSPGMSDNSLRRRTGRTGQRQALHLELAVDGRPW